MNKTILTLMLGVAIGGPLGVGASVMAQVGRADVREPFQPGVVDGICVLVDKSRVDGGNGTQRSNFVGARVEANATLLSTVPDEDPSRCSTQFQCQGACLTEFRDWYNGRVATPLKQACRMP